MIEPVLTESFQTAVIVLEKAITEKRIIGVVSPPGVGFKFAAKRFAMKHYLRIVYANVEHTQSVHNVLCSVSQELSNMKFSNIDRRNTTLYQLILKINERVSEQDACLLILDNCNLTPTQLEYLIRFFTNFSKKIGLTFRMRLSYYKALKERKKLYPLYVKLFKVTDHWKRLSSPTEKEVVDICKAHGVNDKMIISDLVKTSKGNLTMLSKHIQQYFEYIENEQHINLSEKPLANKKL